MFIFIQWTAYAVSTGGIKNVFVRLKSTVKEEEKEGEEGEDPKMKTVPIKEAFQNFIHNKRMWVFAAIVAVVSFAFYIWRQFEVVNAPFLNLKYMLLLYLFIVAEIVDAHYSIIPNQLIAVGILYWILLCAFAIFLQRQSLLTVLAFSGVGMLFGGGVLLLCRVLMKNSMG